MCAHDRDQKEPKWADSGVSSGPLSPAARRARRGRNEPASLSSAPAAQELLSVTGQPPSVERPSGNRNPATQGLRLFFMNRRATRGRQARHNRTDLGPTEPCVECSQFLLSFGGEWDEYY